MAAPSSPARQARARDFFRRGGLLASWHPQYEYRHGQLDMAHEVELALAESKHLIVEAGTGTGKTLAYLLPTLASGRRVIISTGTKNLQEQLFYKDVPFIEQHWERPLRVAYMKGRQNYLCREKLYEAEKRPILSGFDEIEEFALIKAWEPETETGDRAELKQLRQDSGTWHKLDARRELCAGSKCPHFERCFITKMHQRAAEADLIIVNHHLFFADLALREDDFASIIPDYQAVIFDEAHEIEEVAGQHFGVQLSNYRLEELARDVRNVAHQNDCGSPGLDRAIDLLAGRAMAFFALFERIEGRKAFRDREGFRERFKDEYSGLLGAVQTLEAALKLIPQQPDPVLPLERRCSEVETALRLLFEEHDERYVYWMERRGRGVFLQATPIDVAGLLSERLFEQVPTVVLTSATLAVDGSFDYLRDRLGVTEARELIVPGHFDYATQALLYVASELPDPRSVQFTQRAADEALALLRASRGRAFVLFTSYQQMRAVYEIVSFALEYPCLLQGTAPNSALLEEFRSTPGAVLFATASFWQGVDVPGEQLSLVIIDKLPFAAPSDPVVEARIKAIRQAGGNPFVEYQIPDAVLTLKQGFGRLIRSSKDRGVLALLDSRVVKQSYGRIFLDSLPDYQFSTERADVVRFFEEGAA
ncbi:MAG: DEAD/DEAH box helicase [Acidobacteria bacterium]|nr:DEAD/DEAH box helicase [Acidobacteriota bacterium]